MHAHCIQKFAVHKSGYVRRASRQSWYNRAIYQHFISASFSIVVITWGGHKMQLKRLSNQRIGNMAFPSPHPRHPNQTNFPWAWYQYSCISSSNDEGMPTYMVVLVRVWALSTDVCQSNTDVCTFLRQSIGGLINSWSPNNLMPIRSPNQPGT